jgi:hypothetical protein
MTTKTREQQLRTFERKDDVPKEGDAATLGAPDATAHPARHPEARASEFPVSRQGMNQESQHNKHNAGGQAGHKPQH